MKPSVRKKLRVIEAELYLILHNEELLHPEHDLLNSAMTDILCADYYVSHLGISHSEAYAIEKDLESC